MRQAASPDAWLTASTSHTVNRYRNGLSARRALFPLIATDL